MGFLPTRVHSKAKTFQQYYSGEFYLRKNLLSKILENAYFLKCHYFLGRHFLARYLKVRCLIDCKESESRAIFEFRRLKCSLPFEHIVRCFLRHELRRLEYDIN